MRRHLSKIVIAVMILVIGVVIFTPHTAQACNWITAFISPADCIKDGAENVLNSFIAELGNLLLKFTSWAVLVGGIFLTMSMNVTLHIKELYASIPAIESTWITIRDLSSMFIIFMLLYSAIIMILGVKGPTFKSMVLNIFLAGMLINFSLFFVKVGVDASNLISLQFYNAIAPENTSRNFSTLAAYQDGGLSNIFMQSLRIPQIYDDKTWLKNRDKSGSVILATFGGAILMITAAISFFAAAIAFTIRTGLLVFIMALSPIFFVGMIFPQVKAEVSNKLLDLLKNQLLFMPIYLGLMYVALRFISDKGFMAIFNTSATDPSLAGAVPGFTMAGVIIQYTIAALFINAPLVAALKFGAMGAKWAPQVGGVAGIFGRNTLGRGARGLGKGFDSMAASAQNTRLGRGASTVLRTLGISQAVRGGLSGAEKSKYGSAQSLGDSDKENKERSRTIAGMQRSRDQKSAISAVTNGRFATAKTEQIKNFRDNIKKMGNKDFENMDFATLSDPAFASNLSSKQVDTLVDSDVLTPQQKDKFKEIRKNRLSDIFKSSISSKVIQDHMKNLSGKELATFESVVDATGASVLGKASVIDQYNLTQIKEMEDILDVNTKRIIGNAIRGLPPTNTHKAFGFMREPKNRRLWS